MLSRVHIEGKVYEIEYESLEDLCRKVKKLEDFLNDDCS